MAFEFTAADEQIKELVRSCTSDTLIQPDWAIIMDICDRLNLTPALCSAVSSAVLSRLQNRNPDVGILALHLIESLVKNVASFHPYAADRRFLDVLVIELEKTRESKQNSRTSSFMNSINKLVGNNSGDQWRSNLAKQEKILLLIEAWGKAFADSKAFPNFKNVYQELKIKGVRFPQPLKDELAPVFTPEPVANSSGEIAVTDKSLIAHRENVNLLNDMLNASEPSEDLKKNALVQDLIVVLQHAQKQTLNRIAANASEGTLAQLLQVNDEIVQVLQFYEGLLNGTAKRVAAQKKPSSKTEKKSKEKNVQESDNELGSDLLGITDGSKTNSRKSEDNVRNARKSSSDAIVPKLAPPPGSKLTSRASAAVEPEVRKNSNGGDDLLDILGLGAPVNQSETTELDKKAARNSSISKKKKKNKQDENTPKNALIKSDEDCDDFLAIALREEKPAETVKTQSSNPFDSLF